MPTITDSELIKLLEEVERQMFSGLVTLKNVRSYRTETSYEPALEALRVKLRQLRGDPPPPAVSPVTQGLTTDHADPDLDKTRPDGQQVKYLVLSEEERAKGFVRPLRRAYRHVGVRPKHPLRDLTQEEHERYDRFGYVKYEEYPKPNPDGSSAIGRFWTQADLRSGCGQTTTMGLALCETYAASPNFYGATFCCHCGKHLPVGEFVWVEDGAVVGS